MLLITEKSSSFGTPKSVQKEPENLELAQENFQEKKLFIDNYCRRNLPCL